MIKKKTTEEERLILPNLLFFYFINSIISSISGYYYPNRNRQDIYGYGWSLKFFHSVTYFVNKRSTLDAYNRLWWN